MSAQLEHRDLEAGARARRRLLEHHPQHAARRGSACGVARDAQLAQLLGAPDQRLDAAVGNIPEAEEVSALSCSPARSRSSCSPRLPEHAIEDLDRLVDLRFADYQRRHQTDDVAAGHRHQQPGRARPRDHVRRIAVDDQPLQQAPPARAARLGAPPLRQPQQRGAEVSRPSRGSARAGPARRSPAGRRAPRRSRTGCRRTSTRACPARSRARPPRWPASRRSGRRPPAPWPASRRRGRRPPLRTRRTCPCARCRSGSRRRSAPRPRRCRRAAAPAGSRRGGRLMPPSAWIGSTMTAAVRSVIAARAAAASPNGHEAHRRRPAARSPSRYFGWPVTLSAPIVRPWKLFSKATISVRSGWPRVTI